MFHKISNDLDYLHMSIRTEEIKTIVRWSKSYGEIIGLDDFVNSNEKKCNFIVTFDDGYKNNLKFLQCCPETKAIIYLATSYIGTGNSFWADTLQSQILLTKKNHLNLDCYGFSTYKISSEKEKKHAIIELNQLLKPLHPDEIRKIMDAIVVQLDIDTDIEDVFLSWDDVKELHSHAIDIGSHTHNHVITTNVTREELESEFQHVNKIIENQLHGKVVHFAYPNGRESDICDYYEDILNKYGFKTAVTTIEGANTINDAPFLLKRINMTHNRITNPFGITSRAMFTTLLTNPFGIH